MVAVGTIRFFFLFTFLMLLRLGSTAEGATPASSTDFQADFCRVFFCSPTFDPLGSNFPHLGDEAREPLLEPPRDPPVLEDGRVAEPEDDFLAELLLFFLTTPSVDDLADLDREFCRWSLPPTDLGDTIVFLATFDTGRLVVDSGPSGSFSCFTGDFLGPEDRLLRRVLIGEPLEDFAALAAVSDSADLIYCLIHCLTPFSVVQGEQGSRVQGFDSVKSKMEMAMYLPQSS